MRRRRLWCIVLISAYGFLLLTTARPASIQFSQSLPWEHVNQTCRSGDCDDAINHEQLRAIESYMNHSADPCKSFHSYACGNWPRQHPHSTTMMKIANNQLTERYQAIFKEWLKLKPAAEAMRTVQALKSRRACAAANCLPEKKALADIQEMPNEELVTNAACKDNCGGQDILNIASTKTTQLLENSLVQKLLQYYEVCKTKSDLSLLAYFEWIKPRLNLQAKSFNWLATTAELGRFGYSSHFLGMNAVQMNGSMHRIMIYPHDIEHHVEINAAMYDILSTLTKYTQTELQQRFNELEANFQNSSCQYCLKTTSEQTSNENNESECDCFNIESLTFATLNAQLPAIDWQRYLSTQFGRHIEAHEILEVGNFELIKVQVQMIEEIDNELKLAYTIGSFLKYMLKQQEYLHKHNNTALNCLHHMRKLFALPMNFIYEQAIFSSKRTASEKVIQEIFQELKNQFSITIRNNKMQFSTDILQKLQSKLTNLRINVGNLPKDISNDFFDEFIELYNFTNDFHYNHLHALEVFFQKFNSLLDVSSTTLQHTWHSFNLHLPHIPDNLDATPYYYALSNLIVIPFSYLQTPFYDANFWPALLYGDLANTLGHELIHAFDPDFLNYDANGNPSVQPLASMFLNPNFAKNLACLKQGTFNVGERIADVSGARLALNSFLNLDPNALSKNGPLYFLQFAQFFCGTTDSLTFQLEDPLHDIDNMRLDYVLGVLPEFAEVFKCPIGSGMNPVEKCEMYR